MAILASDNTVTTLFIAFTCLVVVFVLFFFFVLDNIFYSLRYCGKRK